MFNRDVIEQVNKQFRLLITQIEDGEAEIERLREALTQIASGNVFETAFPTAELITAPELEDGYLVASEFARAALQPKEGEV